MIIDLDSWEAGYYDALAGRPFACGIPNARALAALGLSSFKISTI